MRLEWCAGAAGRSVGPGGIRTHTITMAAAAGTVWHALLVFRVSGMGAGLLCIIHVVPCAPELYDVQRRFVPVAGRAWFALWCPAVNHGCLLYHLVFRHLVVLRPWVAALVAVCISFKSWPLFSAVTTCRGLQQVCGAAAPCLALSVAACSCCGWLLLSLPGRAIAATCIAAWLLTEAQLHGCK